MHLLLRTGLFALLLVSSNCSNSSTDSDQWAYLFDGTSLEQWKMYGAKSDSISPKWNIEDGIIVASKNGNGLGVNTGFNESLMTKKKFQNFDLQLEFNISEGGNSGIMYHVVEDSTIPMDYYTGHEYQILDDNAFEGTVRDFQLTGSVFGLFPAENKSLNPNNSWNSARIVVKDGVVQHWLNGSLILEFDRNSDAYESAYQNSQWTQFPDWGKTDNGHITLQDHGDKVRFRNIKIKEI